jgi:hypothetical protein
LSTCKSSQQGKVADATIKHTVAFSQDGSESLRLPRGWRRSKATPRHASCCRAVIAERYVFRALLFRLASSSHFLGAPLPRSIVEWVHQRDSAAFSNATVGQSYSSCRRWASERRRRWRCCREREGCLAPVPASCQKGTRARERRARESERAE